MAACRVRSQSSAAYTSSTSVSCTLNVSLSVVVFHSRVVASFNFVVAAAERHRGRRCALRGCRAAPSAWGTNRREARALVYNPSSTGSVRT